jgi:ubiquitin conjugation factor E4 B
LQVNERLVAGDGFMLNFLSVMQMLSLKVKLDKVDPFYLYGTKSRIDTKDKTRLRMNAQDYEQWLSDKGLSVRDLSPQLIC